MLVQCFGCVAPYQQFCGSHLHLRVGVSQRGKGQFGDRPVPACGSFRFQDFQHRQRVRFGC